ncbi:MAG: type II CRISPR RNA-guided endonuclease Cas9 [Clostridia bacterium]|nr:type II CRISPR RNA-guided endonuclease Cas9 [Clostridia bacterium]
MKKFYLGLDIGTNSVGIAATDEDYNLLRAKGQDLISVRLFEEAQTAQERRVKRCARRRLQRRRQRIEFLQDVFAPFIEDKNFFLRLNSSGYHFEDKPGNLNSRYSLFADNDYNDKTFYKNYPTIYHLRYALMTGSKDVDLRHFYLAIHHLVKYRGHFLFEGENLVQALNARVLFEKLNSIWIEVSEESALYFSPEKAESFKDLALDKSKRLNDKKNAATEIFGVCDVRYKDTLSLLLGGTGKPSNILKEEYKDKKGISFAKMSDEEFDSLQEEYGDDFAILQNLREIYNYIVFERVLNGNESISKAMIAIYDTHKSNLKKFKDFVKLNYGLDFYKKIFKSLKEGNNYVNYIGYSKPQKKKLDVKKCTEDDFYKYLKKQLEENRTELIDEDTLNTWLTIIEEKQLFPKIINADNGIFPHQVNLAELDLILIALEKKYTEFGIKDADGLSPAEKIRKIFLFKIPYYVGPLNNHSKNSWVVRKPGKITPWNFDEMIDKSETNERFIRRMTNKCTYLVGKDVLPDCSIDYQKFNVLNQLNKLKINEVPISIELKQALYNDLFLKYPKVTDKKIKEYLIVKGYISKAEEKEINLSGKDGDFKASMSSYITLKKILGNLVDENPVLCEDIILWHTINTDKRNVEYLILKKYGDVGIVREKIKQLKGITSFKEFGRLSKAFLTEVSGGIDSITGEVYTILGELYNTNQNLNEILHNEKYSFINEIQIQNGEQDENISKEDLDELYVSPQVRRGIWQALTMVDEYVKVLGKTPDKIFIEVARSEGEKVRTISRKNQILNLYKECNEVKELVEELNRKTDADLRSERLYLYFLQRGRCAYTGNIINLEDLVSDMYDVDHILPRSITKDDSIDNKVLVLRSKNKQKSDTYPLPIGFTNQQSLWKELKDANLMSAKKYDLLTRVKPLDEDDFNSFINRQLVVTNQTNKAVADLLKRKFERKGCKIVFSKAGNVNNFKSEFKIVKCRETNDFHHARDAYLNVVVGNVYDTKFSNAKSYFYQNGDVWKEYNLKYLFHTNILGAWNEDSINIVLKTLSRTGIMVTQYSYVNKGKFYDETVYTRDSSGLDAPRKNSEPYKSVEKYGGYSSLKTAYFSVVKSKDKKGGFVKTIESVPVLVDYSLSNSSERLLEFFVQERGLIQPEIIVPKLKIKSLITYNGMPAYVAGTTGNRILLHNAVEWRTNYEIDEYVNALVKLISWERDKKLSAEELGNSEFKIKTNRFHEIKLCINAKGNLKLFNQIILQLSKPIYQGVNAAKTVKTVLEEHYEDFTALSTLNQAKIIIQLVKWLKCNAEICDLTLIKGAANCGKLCISKNITDASVEIINYSPCGTSKKIVKI